MITLHHLRIGRSIFTLWLLEEIGCDFDVKTYLRDENFRAQADLKAVHPLGKSPVIEDGDLLLSESGAITNYLLTKYDTDHRMHPSQDNLAQWARYQQWLAYPEGSVFAPLLVKMMTLRSGVEHPVLSPFSMAEIALHFNHIADQLGDNDFILGDSFSGADIGITYMISMGERLGLMADYPSLTAYVKRNCARPAFLAAIEKGVE